MASIVLVIYTKTMENQKKNSSQLQISIYPMPCQQPP